MEQSVLELIITLLLAANTAVVGFGVKMLLARLDFQDAKLEHAHDRITEHVIQFHSK
ncbi:MAG: hypothetical protein JXR40_03920 [Pontiellaceae bacterium]|nr:hypothetical protein [Pontiellaceae bacterium]